MRLHGSNALDRVFAATVPRRQALKLLAAGSALGAAAQTGGT